MALPKLNVPSFELTLPSTGAKIKYRPFLVKEHKALLMLKDSTDDDVVRIIQDIIEVCTFNKIKASTLPSFDLEFIFMNLRAKSVGEIVDLYVNCDCGNNIPYQMNINDLKVEKSEGHATKIQLTDSIGIEMSYPKFNDTIKVFSVQDYEHIIEMVLGCVKAIYTSDGDYEEITPDNIDELRDFVLSMTKEQFEKIERFFVTMPKLKHDIHVTCDKCGKENHTALEGLQNFFV